MRRGKWETGGKGKGTRSINGRYKIDRGRLRIIWEMEKPKNLFVRPVDRNYGGTAGGIGGTRQRGAKGENIG